MGINRAKIRVDAPLQGDAVVWIYRADGVTVALSYTTETGATEHTFPVTVDAGESTEFWMAVGDYVASTTVNNVEMAGGYGLTRAYRVENDGWILKPDSPGGGGSGGGGGEVTDPELVAISNLSSAADKLAYFTGSGTAALTTFTAAGRALVDDADAAAQRATLGLVIGTDVQAYDPELTALAGVTSAADKIAYFTGSGAAATTDFTSTARSLLDDASTSAMRTTLGLGTAALISSTAGGDLSGTLPSPTVAKINGIAVTGTPASGYVPTATSSSAATWQAKTLASQTDVDVSGLADTNVLTWSTGTSKFVPTAVLAPGATFAQAQAVNAQTGTTYTLVAGDAGKLVTLSNASAITLTLPQDSDATIAVGTYVDLMQLGAGQVTVAAGTGATLRKYAATAKAAGQYASFGVQKISTNTWRLFGELAAS